MRPEPVAIQDLIESLADGTPVDWAGLEAGAKNDQERRTFRNLRLVARVADLHRTLSVSDDVSETTLAPELPDAPHVWGHLQVGEQLARGNFGDLYHAVDPKLDRDVALKLIRPRPDGRETTRLLSEARALARVTHPNVVTVHGADVHDGRPGLWMELVNGRTLAALVGERGRFDAPETIGIGRDLCHALTAVHAAAIVHSDVKPQNVMREPAGRVVLMDFGAGRREGAESEIAGTPMYLAPEVLAGEPPTPQSDVYSLGVTLFYLLTATYPYTADDLNGLRAAHADGARAELRDLRPDLPNALVDVVERALDADPARRFQTAAAMEHALAHVQKSADAWKRMSLAAVIAVAALVVLAIAWPRIAGTPAQSLAVLPLTATGDDPAHLIDGLSADLIRELQRYDLQVKTATSAAVLKATTNLDSQLDANAIASGEARHATGRTTVTVHVRRAGVAPFWTRDYDVPDTDLPSVARTVASDVAQAVGAALRPQAPPPPYQTSLRAFTAYQSGRFLSDSRSEADLMRSLEYFAEAAKLDPAYGEPLAGMADVYFTLGVPPFGQLRPMEARILGRKAAENALRINPNLAEAETALAWSAELYDWDWSGSETRFKRAIALNPQYAKAHHWYSMMLTDMGRFDEARAELERARVIEPLTLLFERDLGWIFFLEGKYNEAEVPLRDTLGKDAKYTAAVTLLARVLAGQRRFAEALTELERARADLSRGSYLSFRGYIEAAAGDPNARQTLAELKDVARTDYVTPYYFALIYTALGQQDDAIAELQRAYAEQDSTLGSINADPRFAPIRSDVRFQKIIDQMRFPAPRR